MTIDDDFFSYFGMTIDEAEEKAKSIAEQSNKVWSDIIRGIEDKANNQSNKEKIKWQIELLKRKKLTESL